MTLFYAILLAIATFIWGWIFYKKDYHPQPYRVIAMSFVAGLFSMIPVFGYKYVYVHYMPQIAEFRILMPLLESAVFSGLLFFFVNMLIVVSLLTLLSSVINLLLTRFRHETLRNIRATMKDDEFEYVTMSSLLALLIFGERLVENYFNVAIVHTMVGVIMFLAVIEEYVKHLTVRFVDDRKIKDIDDAITLSIVVGLAFAFIETIIYGIATGNMAIVLPRALLTMPIHLICSAIFGYYYGLARFAEPILEAEKKQKKYQIRFRHLHTILKMKKSDVYEEEKTAQGLIMATLFHTIANVLFELDLAFVTVPLIVVGLMAVTYYYKESRFLYKLLHNKSHQ